MTNRSPPCAQPWAPTASHRWRARSTISTYARIVAIADVFGALTSVRPYKPVWPVERAVEHPRAQAGRHFDPALVERFIEALPQVLKVREQFLEKG